MERRRKAECSLEIVAGSVIFIQIEKRPAGQHVGVSTMFTNRLLSQFGLRSKWDRIERRMLCHITANWRGRPLETREVIVNLIANTRTSKGLTIQAHLNVNSYSKGIKVSDEEMTRLNITPEDFHGEWNYSLSPRFKSE